MAQSAALALQSLIGLALLPLAAYAMSEDKRHLQPRQLAATIIAGVALQLVIALVLLKIPESRALFDLASRAVAALQRSTEAGTRMVFGYLGGAEPPFDPQRPHLIYILAFRALPLMLVLSALSRLLYHWGVLQRVVALLASVLQRAFGIGGPLGTATAANVFLGMVEAPLLVRPYLAQMGRGALFATMVAGMATIAGTVMGLYASILEPSLPGAAGHMLAASLMNAPAALMLARLAVPQGFADGPVASLSTLDDGPRSSIDAVVQGTTDGLRLLAGVAAMLIVMVALVALANEILSTLPHVAERPLSLQRVLGWICAPVAFAIGIPWSEAATAGTLIGEKIVLNELFAYLDMAALPREALSPRSRLILTYALCGFANLGSLGIMIGGLVAMAPERRGEIVALAPRAMLVGLMATLSSAAVVGAISW